LAEESQSELSEQGLNFIAIASSSSLQTTVVIDGVQDEAPGYDSSIKVNNILDSNSTGEVKKMKEN
jgi:hypothetical protein